MLFRSGARSLELATAIDSSDSTFASVETLAMAHAELKSFDRAQQLQQFVLDALAGPASEPGASWRIQRLARYQQDLPCREPFASEEIALFLGWDATSPATSTTSIADPQAAGTHR